MGFIFALVWYLLGCWILLAMIKEENKRCPKDTLPFGPALLMSMSSWIGVVLVWIFKIISSLGVTKRVKKFIEDFESND